MADQLLIWIKKKLSLFIVAVFLRLAFKITRFFVFVSFFREKGRLGPLESRPMLLCLRPRPIILLLKF